MPLEGIPDDPEGCVMATAVAFHKVTGAHRFDAASDAAFACSLHPNEWRLQPWPVPAEKIGSNEEPPLDILADDRKEAAA
jgi:hypothetical protein